VKNPPETKVSLSESQVPTAEVLSTPETLNIVHYVHQHGGSGHYESIVSTKVRFSIDA